MKELVKQALDAILPMTPRPLQRWIEEARTERGRRIRRKANIDGALRGERLISEAGLEAKYAEAIQLLRARGHELGDYLEFGVYAGASLACMHRALAAAREDGVRLFGFDSFQGLPASTESETRGVWHHGQFAMDERFTRQFLASQGVDATRVVLVKGWFSDTLTEALAKRHAITKASLVMVDCDIYSSSREALAFSEPLIRDMAVVFFDDWYTAGLAAEGLGEKRAFDEFLAEHPDFEVEPFGGWDATSESFVLTRRGTG